VPRLEIGTYSGLRDVRSRGGKPEQTGPRSTARQVNRLPAFRWNQYSPAGEVERVGGFARGAANRPGCRRAGFVALVMTLLLLVGLLLGVVLANVL
jgi:hypothetical protein